jgi:transcriptional regulator with XRE-family HTH domain
MTEYSVQPNIRNRALSGAMGSPILPAMPRRGPNKNRAPKPARRAAKSYLKAWRLFRDLTVEELAEKAGMSTGNVSAIENQRQGYSPESLDALAAALKIDTATLLSVDPNSAGSIWSLWNQATATQREQLTSIAKTLIKPR